MEDLYFKILPEELITTILHALYGTIDVYPFIEALNLDEELYVYRMLRAVFDIFKRSPYKVKVGFRFVKWDGCYMDLLNMDNGFNIKNEEDIWASASYEHYYNISSLLVYDYLQHPNYRKLSHLRFI